MALAPFGILSMAMRAARALSQGATRVLRAMAHRGAIHRLSHLDDRALKDIGLTRAEVDGALAAPLHVDPSCILALRRGRGHAYRCAVVSPRATLPRLGRA